MACEEQFQNVQPFVGVIKVYVVSGVWDRGCLAVRKRSRELPDVVAGDLAVLTADDQRRATDRLPTRPIVAGGEIGDAVDDHSLVERGPEAIGAALKAGCPRVGVKALRDEELSRSLERRKRSRPAIQPPLDRPR